MLSPTNSTHALLLTYIHSVPYGNTQHWKLAGPGHLLAMGVAPEARQTSVQSHAPSPCPSQGVLEQHLMSAGSFGHAPEIYFPPPEVQELVLIHVPPSPPEPLQRPFMAPRTTGRRARMARGRNRIVWNEFLEFSI